MLSGLIDSAHSYPAFTNTFITGTPGVRSFWSSRTKKKSSQYCSASTGYGPNCLTHELPYFHKSMDYVFILELSRSWRIIAFSTEKAIFLKEKIPFKKVSTGTFLFFDSF